MSSINPKESKEVIYEVEKLLTNLQPHIPQACYPGKEKIIDNYIDPALELLRSAIDTLYK